MKISKSIKKHCLLVSLGLAASAGTQAQGTLIWSDEFDGNHIDTSIWNYAIGGGGFGNGELQYYTARSENSYIEDGNLVIEARREDYVGSQFTSARLNTNGRMSFRFGTLEARIKLPDLANGLWPAFWMMGTNFGVDGWPRSGEWDIMEAGAKAYQDDGTVNRSISAAMHWWHEDGDWSDYLHATHSESTTVTPDLNEDYHVFKLEWTPYEVIVSVNDTPYFSMDITDPNLSEFHENPAFIILNMAVGGWNYVDITDPNDITAPFPAKMYVDYVRLYENEYTELYLANDNALTGNFGVLTETTPVNNHLDWENTNLYVWNNMTGIDVTPSEGGEAIGFQVGGGDWWGWGLVHSDLNLTNYKHGYLHVDIKTTATTPFSIRMGSTSGGEGSVELAPGGEEYGLVRDGNWHTVTIPLNQFGNIDFATVKEVISAFGGAPGTAMQIAFDNIYLSPSVALPTPEQGSFGIYTETEAHKDAGEFIVGDNGELFIWESTLQFIDGDALEGESALHLSSTGQGWFGLGFTAKSGFNLSAFNNENAALHFSMKTLDQTFFQIGLKSGSQNEIGQKWINFEAGSDPYGFARDGEWHQIVIPISDIAPDVDLSDVRQVFQLLGHAEITGLSIDDIYLSGGEDGDNGGDDNGGDDNGGDDNGGDDNGGDDNGGDDNGGDDNGGDDNGGDDNGGDDNGDSANPDPNNNNPGNNNRRSSGSGSGAFILMLTVIALFRRRLTIKR